MATPPERVRRALLRVTKRARAELRAVTHAAPQDPVGLRAALFATAPLIVSDYSSGAATLALDWYEELRDEAAPQRLFTPTLRLRVTDEDVAATVARVTEMLREVERDAQKRAELTAEAVKSLDGEIERQIVTGFRDTITGNATDDPGSVGWRRFARPEACKFCVMLADRGAVYTAKTARFAAHGAEMRGGRKGGNCMCIAGPAFGGKEVWAEATPIQYMASQRTRTEADKARLREYLNHNFPDAPG